MSPQLRAANEALFPDLTTLPRGAKTPRFPNRARVARAQGTHQAAHTTPEDIFSILCPSLSFHPPRQSV